MTFHHLKISWRHLNRNRVYSLINLLGLSIGIASVLLIGLYVHKELSFDRFFQDSERIYRIPLHRIYPDRTRDFASSPVTLAPVLKENYPEVEAATRLHRMFFVDELTIRVGELSFIEPRVRFADEDFFKVFSHNFIHGDPNTALNAPDKVVLTASTAHKYFGKTDVLNEQIRFDNDTASVIVSGVIEDIPVNSHIHFDVLGAITGLPYLVSAIENNRWMNPWLYTYVKLKAGTDPQAFEAQFDEMLETYAKAHLAQSLGVDYAEAGHKFEYFLQPIEEIHLHSKLELEVEPTSNISYVYLLAVVALIILIISSINYINLSVARSPARAREVGIRKVVGVVRSELLRQFLTESVFICALSAIIALFIVNAVLPWFNSLLNTALSLGPLANPLVILYLCLFVIAVGVISGIYPAMVIAAIEPSRILKGTFKHTKKGLLLRNGLTTLQFVISIIMISGSILVHQQMRFFRNKNLGFNQNNILVINQAGQLGENQATFRNEIAALPGILNAGVANGMPGAFLGSNIFKSVSQNPVDLRANTASFDDYFFETMEFRLLEGRSFDPAYNDSSSIIVNESAVQALGLTAPIGTQLRDVTQADMARNLMIIGVVEDYHFYSLHAEIGPLIIFNASDRAILPRMAIHLSAGNQEGNMALIKDKWRKATESEMSYSFLDQELQQQYESDRTTGWVFDFFTYIALIMCCTGLFGLTTFIAQQRLKEMSIRKVLGASVFSIIMVFSKEFLMLIGIACVLGMPIAYWIMNEWLAGFAYHVEISALLFVLTVVIMVGLIMITVSYQTIKLARVNPIEALRYE